MMRLTVLIGLLSMASGVAADAPAAPSVTVTLKRGSFETYHFRPNGTPRSVLLFGSGDGGWGFIENKTCGFLMNRGIYTVGVDCRKYAKKDYDAATLIADYAAIVGQALQLSGAPSCPVIYGGWSMGAVQAVAAAGGPGRSPQLIGLLLMSADRRGRYGLRFTDTINIEPQGKNTFGLADFTANVAHLRIVQFEAAGDWIANSDWIKSLKSPHRLYVLSNSNHDFKGVSEEFQKVLAMGIDWILDPVKPPGDEAK
jgi:hypothetical protein